MSRLIISVITVAMLLQMCSSGFCHNPKHKIGAKEVAGNQSLKLGSFQFPVALELSTEHEGNFQFPSRWQTMRIRASTKTMGANNYVCPAHYKSRRDWSYNLKGSWEWCGKYCETGTDTNYMTEEKAHLMQNNIIPKALAQFLQTAPLIRRETENLIFNGPLDHNHFCGYVRADDSHYRRGIPDTDVMIYFSLSPFLRAERKSLAWSRTCHYSQGRITGAMINVNPCWLPNQIEEAVNTTVQEIKKALQIASCPEKNSIMLHGANEWYNNVIVCVEVKCKSDKTFEVKFKDGDWIPCPEHHVLGRKSGTEVTCPKFHEVCKEVSKTSTGGSVGSNTREIEKPVVETIELGEDEEEEEEEEEEGKEGTKQQVSTQKSGSTGPTTKEDAEGDEDESVSERKEKRRKQSKKNKSRKGRKGTKRAPPPPESEYNVTTSDQRVLDQMVNAARLARDSSSIRASYYAVLPALCAFLLTVIV